MINILVINKDNDYSVELLNNICNLTNIKISNIANDIEHIHKFLNNNPFDIMLLDSNFLPLANMDDIFKNFLLKYKDAIIVLLDKKSSYKTYQKFDSTYKYNFDYILHLIIEKSAKKLECKNIMKKIKEELNYLGYKPNHFGTKYLADIIYIVYSTNFEGSLESKIYPYIAYKYSKSVNTIKCDIINATTLMACESSKENLIQHLGHYNYLKPSPKTIIYSIINKISS